MNQKVIEECFARIITEGLGLSLADPNLEGTPKRVARMYSQELFRGLAEEPPKAVAFPNSKNYDQIIMADNISFHSTCSHHFLPFSGKAFLLYIPQVSNNTVLTLEDDPNEEDDGGVMGLSKATRIINYFAARPQLQENLTEEIVEYLEEILKPRGVMLVMRATHGCMLCRGVRQPATSGMTTSAVRGVFSNDASAKAEGLALIALSVKLAGQ